MQQGTSVFHPQKVSAAPPAPLAATTVATTTTAAAAPAARYSDYIRIYAGNTTRLYICTQTQTGIKYVLKKYIKEYLDYNQTIYANNEIKILSKLSHENIIKYISHYSDDCYICFYQEYAERGDLCDLVCKFHNNRLPEIYVIHNIIQQLLLAVEYIHEIGVVHRDIKPENILLSKDYKIKLCDFGLAINQNHILPIGRVGTLEFMAPEIIRLNNEKYKMPYNEKVDIWAIGCLAYELIYGTSPFFDINTSRIEYRICNLAPKFTLNLGISAFTLKFILITLSHDAQKRPSATQLLKYLDLSSQDKVEIADILLDKDSFGVFDDDSSKTKLFRNNRVTSIVLEDKQKTVLQDVAIRTRLLPNNKLNNKLTNKSNNKLTNKSNKPFCCFT